MNFTREPIILSVITPKEGSKLVVRNSHLEGQEDYFVDAVEVVSFEGAIFYRSLERPKSFVLPISCYEVLEVKETRMVLKSVEQEKAIKIGGGAKQPFDERSDKMKDKKKGKRRKPSSMPPQPQEAPKKEIEGGEAPPEETPPVSSSVLKKIFPPPNTLIKEKLARYKNEEFFEDNILPLMDEGKHADVEEERSHTQEVPSAPAEFESDVTKIEQVEPSEEIEERQVGHEEESKDESDLDQDEEVKE